MIGEYLVLIDKLESRVRELYKSKNDKNTFVRIRLLEDEISDLKYAVLLMRSPNNFYMFGR